MSSWTAPTPRPSPASTSRLLGQPVTYQSDDWVVVAAERRLVRAWRSSSRPGTGRPTWPDPAVPQQFHLDIMVEDVAASGPLVLALGAQKLDGEDVYADPAGHPFCLIRRPGWAPPIPPGAEPPGSPRS